MCDRSDCDRPPRLLVGFSWLPVGYEKPRATATSGLKVCSTCAAALTLSETFPDALRIATEACAKLGKLPPDPASLQIMFAPLQ